jgi:hypothetical protein
MSLDARWKGSQMRVNDSDLLDDELLHDGDVIRAALEAAINQPLNDLLSIAEFAEKAGLPAPAVSGGAVPEMEELRRAA